MAALGALLGGYGSDDDEDMEQPSDASPSPSAAVAPNTQAQPSLQTAAAITAATSPSALPLPAAADSDTDTQGQQPVRIIDGPSTNPEPPPEGLSPPHIPGGLATTVDEEGLADAAAAAAVETDLSFLLLPPELREPPPGPVHPHLQQEVEKIIRMQEKSGQSLMSKMRGYRAWNNPDFLEKMVDFFHLDQYGSSFNPEVWDPKAIPEEDYWPSLAQQLAAKKRQRGEQVKFTSAGQQQPANPLAAATAAAAAAAAVMAMGQAPGSMTAAAAAAASAAGKVVDPRVEAAQAQAAAVAKQLLKKSKWDK